MESLNPPLYLHYLDRELNEALRGRVDGKQAQATTRRLILGTDSRLYCGLSAIYENDGLQAAQLRDLEELLATGDLDAVSHQRHRSSFLEQRQILYQHDAGRYPRYFTAQATLLDRIEPTVPKPGGTTRNLVHSMQGWAEENSIDDVAGEYARGPLVVAPLVADALRHREDEAITYAYFRRFLDGIRNPAGGEQIVRRQISEAFTRDYIGMYANSDIATGVRGLDAFDERLARYFPQFDDRLIGLLLYYCGLGAVVDGTEDSDRWLNYVLARPSVSHGLLVGYVVCLLRSLEQSDRDLPMPSGHDWRDWYLKSEVRNRLADQIRRAARDSGGQNAFPIDLPPETAFDRAAQYVMSLAARLKRRSARFAVYFEENRRLIVPERADVVLLTSTPVEQEALESRLTAGGYGPPRVAHGEVNSYRMYAPVAGASVAVVRSSMGSVGPGGSEATVQDAIRELKPNAVIAVGIAFGIDRKKTPLGTVLVATQVADYETQKRKRTSESAEVIVIPRGDKMPASPTLLSRIRATPVTGLLQSLNASVEEGLLLSGSKLIDDVEFRDQVVLESGSEAIGGEMEATGLMAASYRLRTPWLVVKAVCDFADGQKSRAKAQRQAAAAANAAAFVLAVLEAGGFAEMSIS